MRTYLRLQARVQLQVVDVAVQRTRRLLQKHRPSSTSVLLPSGLHPCMHDPRTQQKKLTAISGSEFHSSKLPNLLSPKNALNSFIEHTPHPRACAIPSISTTRSAAGDPRARNAPAACSVASCRMRARSASAKRPSGPRCSPANVRFAGSASTDAQVLSTPRPKSRSESWSRGVEPKAFLKISSVHWMSFSAVVACHYVRVQGQYGVSRVHVDVRGRGC